MSARPRRDRDTAPAKTANAPARDTLAFAALALLCLICFLPVLGFDFFVIDDMVYVANPIVSNGITLRGMWFILNDPFSVQLWMPLAMYSHMLDVELFGFQPAGHHATSIAFHIANTLLVFSILKRLTSDRLPSILAAAVFAIHPLQVEPVVWIASRKDLLSAFFFLLAVLLYLAYVRKPTAARMAGIVSLFVLAVSSKSMPLTLPFLLLLLDYWPLRRAPDPFTANASTRKIWAHLVVEKTPLFAVTLLTIAMAWYASRGSEGMSGGLRYAFDERIKNAAVSYVAYLAQTVWPHGLVPYYFHGLEGTALYRALLSAAGLAAVTAFVVWKRTARPHLFVGWMWFGLMLGPVIGILEIGSHARADRYMYLPLLGLSIMACWELQALTRVRPAIAKTLTGLAAFVVIALLIASMFQVQRWRDNEALLRYALTVEPDNPKLHESLAIVYRDRGEMGRAAEAYAAALKIAPDSPALLVGLSDVYMAAGHHAEAEKVLARLIELSPDSVVARILAARNDIARGHNDAARKKLKAVLEANPRQREASELLKRLNSTR